MAADEKRNRPPIELSMPETMKIAALLAELMPGAGGAPGARTLPIATEATAESQAGAMVAAALGFKLPDLFPAVSVREEPHEPVAPPAPPRVPQRHIAVSVTAEVQRPSVAPGPAVDNDLDVATQPDLIARAPTPVPTPTPDETAPSWVNAAMHDLLGGNAAGQPDYAKARNEQPDPQAIPTAADPELIPLGSITTAAFFGLMNWRNDPNQVRHPLREPHFDPATLALLKSIPFFDLRLPRVPDQHSVAAVMSQFSWE